MDDEAFVNENQEIKLGYLNINGLLDGGHAEYLNADMNLKYLDILILSETKLVKKHSDNKIKDTLSDWKIIARYDCVEEKKHMGFLVLTGRKSKIRKNIKSVTYNTLERNNNVQIEGLIVEMKSKVNYGFLYCRSKPTSAEIKEICLYFKTCKTIMGDLNLSHRNGDDEVKILQLCDEKRKSILHEVTRTKSLNQLDYILVNKDMINITFTTSYFNMISDHKTIVARIGSETNALLNDVKEKLFFSREKHLKPYVPRKNEINAERNKVLMESYVPSKNEVIAERYEVMMESSTDLHSENEFLDESILGFSRKFFNPDMATCWLNSCLQLLLLALDYDETANECTLTSELGRLLLNLNQSKNDTLDPTLVKNMIVEAEELRITARLSELSNRNLGDLEMQRESEKILRNKLDMGRGQQCIRDFMLCLYQNVIEWPDVVSIFSFNLKCSTTCPWCGSKSEHEKNEMFLELNVPPRNSKLKIYIERYFNEESEVEAFCSDICKATVNKTQKNTISDEHPPNFLIVVLSRGITTELGYELIENEVQVTDDIDIR